MRYLLLGIFMVLSPFVFTQTEEDSVTYELFFTEKTTDVDGKIKTDRYIEYEPTPEFLKDKNITNRDTIATLSYISGKVIDSLNQLVKNITENNDNEPVLDDEFDLDDENDSEKSNDISEEEIDSQEEDIKQRQSK